MLLNGITSATAVNSPKRSSRERESVDTLGIGSGAVCEVSWVWAVGMECRGFVEAAFCWVCLQSWQREDWIRQI